MHKRIEEIVKLFPKVKTVADIGCDHAYSSILLIRSGKAEHVYACDIGEKALESARRNILKEGLEEKISCHLGDGLSAFSGQDCEALLLSGMGGPLMSASWREDCKNFPILYFLRSLILDVFEKNFPVLEA